MWAWLKALYRRISKHRIDDKAAIISYYALWASVPLAGFLLYLSTYIIGSSESVINDLNLFSQDFFSSINPRFFTNMKIYASKIKEVGILGIYLAVVLGIMLISKVISAIQEIYEVESRKSFFWKRLKEIIILIFSGFFLFGAFGLMGIISAFNRFVGSNETLSKYLNPYIMAIVNNFLVRILIPFLLATFYFFVLYKWIPERRVKTFAALRSAVLASVLWIAGTHVFMWYIENISLASKVFGTLSTVIIFIFWVEISSLILLLGAEISALLNEKDET